MVYLFFIALAIFDVLVILVLSVRCIKGVISSKDIVAKLGWLIYLLINIGYSIVAYNNLIVEENAPMSSLWILVYPPVVVLVCWILKKIKSSKKR